MQALLELAAVVAFFVSYYLHGLYTATATLMVAMGLLLLLDLIRERRIPPMHGLSAGLVAAFGAATLLLHNQRYIQWKPTVFFWLTSAAFLVSFWIGERPLVERLLGTALDQALGTAQRLPRAMWRRMNCLWVLFYAGLGGLNLAVAFNASDRA